MNRFNLIIIIGVTGTGKSLFASNYLASHPQARLIDSLKLYEASPKVTSAFFSTDNLFELMNCDTLLLDEVPEGSFLTSVSKILKYRILHEKKTVILSQCKANIDKILNSTQVTEIMGSLIQLEKSTNLEELCSVVEVMLSIRTDRPLYFNLWQKESPELITEQEQHLSIEPEEWNLLLNKLVFWELILQSNLQSLVMSENGENMKNGTVGWPFAKHLLNKLVLDVQLPKNIKDNFKEVLAWVDEQATGIYELGINFISSSKVEL